jgi:hypothetical protein
MPRIEYPEEYFVSLRWDEQGLLARYVVRWLVVGGKLTRWAVAFQVRRKDGRFRDFVRYDDWHGPLHRHRAGFPPRKPEPMEPPPRVPPIHYAVGDIMLNTDVFLAAAQQDDEIEVEDDDATP